MCVFTKDGATEMGCKGTMVFGECQGIMEVERVIRKAAHMGLYLPTEVVP